MSEPDFCWVCNAEKLGGAGGPHAVCLNQLYEDPAFRRMIMAIVDEETLLRNEEDHYDGTQCRQ